MSKVLLYITMILFPLFCGLLLMCGLAYQSQWNAVLFTFEWTTRQIGIDDSRTRMIDINTRIERVLPFQYVDRARFENSDDGTRSIVVEQHSDIAYTMNYDLYLINFNTVEFNFLTYEPGYDGEPDAVDDLRRIVFVSDRSGTTDLYTLMLDELDAPTVLSRVTSDDLVERDPQWLTREQYHTYMDTYLSRGDPIILNQDATNSF